MAKYSMELCSESKMCLVNAEGVSTPIKSMSIDTYSYEDRDRTYGDISGQRTYMRYETIDGEKEIMVRAVYDSGKPDGVKLHASDNDFEADIKAFVEKYKVQPKKTEVSDLIAKALFAHKSK
jgi:hypothetical protein